MSRLGAANLPFCSAHQNGVIVPAQERGLAVRAPSASPVANQPSPLVNRKPALLWVCASPHPSPSSEETPARRVPISDEPTFGRDGGRPRQPSRTRYSCASVLRRVGRRHDDWLAAAMKTRSSSGPWYWQPDTKNRVAACDGEVPACAPQRNSRAEMRDRFERASATGLPAKPMRTVRRSRCMASLHRSR
jgi:hypothetical protein